MNASVASSGPLKNREFDYSSLPAFVLPFLALLLGHELPAWQFMWTTAFALFLSAKWIAYHQLENKRAAPIHRPMAFFFLWPGMNARAFMTPAQSVHASPRERLSALAKTAVGPLLMVAAKSMLAANHPLLAGWTAMLGIVLFLHFGLFHLLSIFWRARGFNAPPIMRSPLASHSVADFWGGRWNAAFTDLMKGTLFVSLARRFGSARALMAIFLLSGILHELVISVPARGGYGLPTAYFAMQCAGLFFEKSAAGKRLQLQRGLRGWLFLLAITGLPAFWLFPPIFIQNVILPMLRAL